MDRQARALSCDSAPVSRASIKPMISNRDSFASLARSCDGITGALARSGEACAAMRFDCASAGVYCVRMIFPNDV
jgi:hypothetical protein